MKTLDLKPAGLPLRYLWSMSGETVLKRFRNGHSKTCHHGHKPVANVRFTLSGFLVRNVNFFLCQFSHPPTVGHEARGVPTRHQVSEVVPFRGEYASPLDAVMGLAARGVTVERPEGGKGRDRVMIWPTGKLSGVLDGSPRMACAGPQMAPERAARQKGR